MKVLIIPADNSKSIKVEDVDFGKLENIKACLDGGWLELLRLTDDTSAYIDEEGKLKGLPFNLRATSLILCISPEWDDVIVGPMIVFGNLNEDGLTDGNEHSCPNWVLSFFNFEI